MHGMVQGLHNAGMINKRRMGEFEMLSNFKRSYVAQQQYDSWLTKKVERSRASTDADNLIPASDVEIRFAARRAATPVCKRWSG